MSLKVARTILLVLASAIVVSTTHRSSYTIDDFVDGEVANDVLNLSASADNDDTVLDDSESLYERQRRR